MEQNKKQKKIPLRQCLGCNEHKPKKELLRVLRTPEGEVFLDFTTNLEKKVDSVLLETKRTAPGERPFTLL